MGRKSIKEIRQKEIIRAFYQVCKKEGLENASIAKVASHLGINPSLIMHYFKTREELIFGLISYTLERYRLMFRTEKDNGDSQKQLSLLIHKLFSRKWGTLFDDGVFYSCYALVFRDDKIRQHFLELHQDLRRWLAEAIANAKGDGYVDVEDPELTADLIFALVDGSYYYFGLLAKPQKKNTEHYKKIAFEILKLTAAEIEAR
ncbi:MAG: hypothetical protein DHS20C17_00630 [Cyclobacteriaceae bacterium]|nr:MAG: hypothetical protein DHS20C17_00630 [Cyclobacteriaceae bacterium]